MPKAPTIFHQTIEIPSWLPSLQSLPNSTPDRRSPSRLVGKFGDNLLTGEPTPVKCPLTIRRRRDVSELHPDISSATRLVSPHLRDCAILSALLLNISMDVVEEFWISGQVNLGHVEHAVQANKDRWPLLGASAITAQRARRQWLTESTTSTKFLHEREALVRTLEHTGTPFAVIAQLGGSTDGKCASRSAAFAQLHIAGGDTNLQLFSSKLEAVH